MENFLQILQRTMKILAMAGRLSMILMANIKHWADKASKQQVLQNMDLMFSLFTNDFHTLNANAPDLPP